MEERAGGAAVGTSFDLYVLIHPEPFPSNEPGVFHADFDRRDSGLEGLDVSGLDALYGRLVAAGAALAAARVAVLDECSIESLALEASVGEEPQLVDGVPIAGWTVVAAEPQELEKVPAALEEHFGAPAGRSVLLGGFARHDCVARVRRALARAGWQVVLDQLATLPLRDCDINDLVGSGAIR